MNLIEALETVVHTASEVTPTVKVLEEDQTTSEQFLNDVKYFWRAVDKVDNFIAILKEATAVSERDNKSTL